MKITDEMKQAVAVALLAAHQREFLEPHFRGMSTAAIAVEKALNAVAPLIAAQARREALEEAERIALTVAALALIIHREEAADEIAGDIRALIEKEST